MALNVATFKTRTLSAVVFIAVMAIGLLHNGWSFFLLFSLIHFGCWVEFQKLAGLQDPEYKEISPFHRYGVMLAGWCFLLYFTNDDLLLGGLSLHAIGWWLGLMFAFVLPISELLFSNTISLKNISFSAFGVLYISVTLGLLIDLMAFTPELNGVLQKMEHAGYSVADHCLYVDQ